MATKKVPWHGKVKDKLNLDELAHLFDLPAWEKIDESNMDNQWEHGNYAYKEALEHGASEAKAEKAREKAEEEAGSEVYVSWGEGVIAAADQLFRYHYLELIPIKGTGRYPYEFKVVPKTTWDSALGQIIETINGVGMFHFASAREFLDSGPYSTPRIGVLTHLHHIASYPAVYGDYSAKRTFERSFR